jgi:hypothetical protein
MCDILSDLVEKYYSETKKSSFMDKFYDTDDTNDDIADNNS